MKQPAYQLILGSGSPRRKQLLEELGFVFEVKPLHTDESYPSELQKKMIARYLAQKKAAAYKLAEGDLVITADTTVILNDQLLEKPANAGAAKQMLEMLSGKSHLVITGVCCRALQKTVVFDDATIVSFRGLTSTEIDFYVDRFQPFDKAGAYGIQEWIGMIGVEKMEGSYFTVMGLPVHLLYQHLLDF